jgi:hypothetical protein
MGSQLEVTPTQFLAPATSPNAGSVTYATPGTYVTTFTVTDNAGLSDPNPPTRTITAQPDFSLSASPASQTVAQGNSTSFTATVTAGTGFAGNVSLSVSGLPAGATPLVPRPSPRPAPAP